MSELKCVVGAMFHLMSVPPGPGIDFSVADLLSVRTVFFLNLLAIFTIVQSLPDPYFFTIKNVFSTHYALPYLYMHHCFLK